MLTFKGLGLGPSPALPWSRRRPVSLVLEASYGISMVLEDSYSISLVSVETCTSTFKSLPGEPT